MKRIIQQTKSFRKSFKKIPKETRIKFISCLELFLTNEFFPSLKTHQLKGDKKDYWSFSVYNDVRAIYKKEIRNNQEIIIFKFIDIGSHNKVY